MMISKRHNKTLESLQQAYEEADNNFEQIDGEFSRGSKAIEEVYVHDDWIVDINYSKGPLNSHTNTYRLGEEYAEEEAVREAYTMFIAELGVEYSNSILASSDIVIVNARQLPTPSYRTIKLN